MQENEIPDDPLFNEKITLFSDKEATTQTLDNFKDYMEGTIGLVCKTINTNNKEQEKQLTSDLDLKMHQRNRQIVKEIIDTCKNFKEEVNQHFEKLREEFEDN